jgi:hypothetical protein
MSACGRGHVREHSTRGWVKPTVISLQGVSASDEAVGSLRVATDDEVCAQPMAHAWGEQSGRKPCVSVEVSPGTREAPEAEAEACDGVRGWALPY